MGGTKTKHITSNIRMSTLELTAATVTRTVDVRGPLERDERGLPIFIHLHQTTYISMSKYQNEN